jgi:DNA (cytosine-5)-methyltransferase 1
MKRTRYISLFSGIGGLEHPAIEPLLFCERDAVCQKVLKARHPAIPISGDIAKLTDPPKADFVAGGWPCQDLSIAGKQSGLSGSRSSLFFEMLKVARSARAHTLIGENVPNLLTINRGQDFDLALSALVDAGYRYVAWRVLNAREFGLPQERRRLFLVASTHLEYAWALHAEIPALHPKASAKPAYGFYWTAGARSLCFSKGYVPALKIGASDDNGRSPVAVLQGSSLRKLSAAEFLRLQGFAELVGTDIAASALLRMAGNAVALPVGQFVMESVIRAKPGQGMKVGFGTITPAGLYDDGVTWEVKHRDVPLAANLSSFLDPSGTELTPQACAGLIVRAVRAGHAMPKELFDALQKRAEDRTQKIKPSRSNSFVVMDTMTASIRRYAAQLEPLKNNRTG